MTDTARCWPGLLLALMLVAAQFSAAMHAYAHDPGAPQTKTCSTCATVAQLGVGAVDNTPELALPRTTLIYPNPRDLDPAPASRPAQRQRGPPPRG